jgi:hypothetical protein
MTPNAITPLFKEAHDAFPPLKGKPSGNNLLAIRETLLPLLMVIPYDQLNGVHSLIAILTNEVKYKADHGAKLVRPARLPLFDKMITDNATTVVCIRAEAAQKSQLDDHASYKVANQGMSKFLRNIVNEIWYNDIKNANTFYTKVTAIEIMSLLDANSGGLHALDMILLCTDMMQYHVQADGIPQFIVMMEDSPKKAKQAGMPIANVELVMMASAAVLAAQHFPHEINNWEGLSTASHTWQAWKVAFRLFNLKRQHQLQAPGGGKPLGGAQTVIPSAVPTIDRIGEALENLALAVSSDTNVLQQLTAANLALTVSVNLRMVANKRLLDALACNKGDTALATLATPASAPVGTISTKTSLGNQGIPGQLLLDPWSQGQLHPHKCSLHSQSTGTQGGCDNRQHNGL